AGRQVALEGLLAAVDEGVRGPRVGVTVGRGRVQAPAVVAIRLELRVVRVREPVPVAPVDDDVGPGDSGSDLGIGRVRGVRLDDRVSPGDSSRRICTLRGGEITWPIRPVAPWALS